MQYSRPVWQASVIARITVHVLNVKPSLLLTTTRVRTILQVAIMSIQAFKDCPSRFLAQRYKASELNGAETKDILTRLLRIEGLAGWKVQRYSSFIFAPSPPLEF